MDRALASSISEAAAGALALGGEGARRLSGLWLARRSTPARWLWALLVALLVALSALPATAHADPIELPIVYSTTTSPPKVKRTTLTYDPAPEGGGAPTAVLAPLSTVATLPVGYGGGVPGAADGVALLGDGTIFIASRGSNIHRVDPGTGAVSFSIASLAAASPPPPVVGFLRMDPSNTALWTPGVDGRIARTPIASLLKPGVSYSISGDDTIVQGLAFVGGRAFYSTPSGSGSGGSVGVLDTATFVTTRLLSNLPAAAPSVPAVPQQRASALVVDPLTGNLVLIGQKRITQIALDWSVSPPAASIAADRDLSSQLGTARLIGGTVDGNGRLIALSSDGRLILIDYSASELIDSGGAVVRVLALDSSLGNIAPLSGPGSLRTSGKVWASGGVGQAFDGAFDERNGQLSLIAGNSGYTVDARTADDFYLEPSAIYRIDTIRATMFSNVPLSPTPKAKVEVYADCDGAPGELLHTFEALVADTGEVFGGLRVLSITAPTPDLWLHSGPGGRTYWLSVVGVANTQLNPPPWYWGTSGEQKIAGSPAHFLAPSLGFAAWTNSSELPCGCTDFAFRIEGKRCDTLLDNGRPVSPAAISGPPGSPTLRSVADTSTQSADDLPVQHHSESLVCYARARIYTNCDPIVGAFELYESACMAPAVAGGSGGGAPTFTAPFSRVTPVESVISYQGEVLHGYDVEAFDLSWLLPGGRNYHVSVVLSGTGSLRQRALWAFSDNCATPNCRVRFNEATVLGPSIGAPAWTPLSRTQVSPGVRRDLSFYLGGRKLNRGCPVPDGNGSTDPNPPPTGCPADFNGDGVSDLADLVRFLEVWLPGCP